MRTRASMVKGLVVALALLPFLKDEESLANDHGVPRAVVPTPFSLGRPMPSKPFPRQRRPPCVRGEREIHGACWLGPIKDQEPPCGESMFDYQGECFVASFDHSPPPTS